MSEYILPAFTVAEELISLAQQYQAAVRAAQTAKTDEDRAAGKAAMNSALGKLLTRHKEVAAAVKAENSE